MDKITIYTNETCPYCKAVKEKLTEDETFELQQHLLSNLDKLDEEDKLLLKQLSQN